MDADGLKVEWRAWFKDFCRDLEDSLRNMVNQEGALVCEYNTYILIHEPSIALSLIDLDFHNLSYTLHSISGSLAILDS